MRRLLKFTYPVLAVCLLVLSLTLPAVAAQDSYVCAVYFTGIGCSHCEMTAPLMLEQLPGEYPNLVVIEYEIYGKEQNTIVFDEYVSTYHTEYQIPLVIFGQDRYLADHAPITTSIRDMISEADANPCPLASGSSQDFKDLDLSSLPGYPVVWHQEKVLIRTGPQGNGELLKELLINDNLSDVLKDAEFEIIEPIEVAVPGREIEFDNGIKIEGWIFQWNGEGIAPPQPIPPEPEPAPPQPTPPEPEPTPPTPEPASPMLTLPKVLSLAVADAVNPCAFTVLLLLLVSIIAYNPGNRRSILYAGLAFTGSVFGMYFVYGLVFIKFFQVIQALAAVRVGLFTALAIAAIVFGIFNIRDFVKYKPGGVGTEMPLLLRPRVKKLLSTITSTKGAAVAGVIVTVFLLPCTIGPYIIAAGILSSYEMVKNVPPLLLYNLVFILPFLGITGSVYLGLGRVQDVYQWKQKNITKLHLIAGIIILGLGIYMLLESLHVLSTGFFI